MADQDLQKKVDPYEPEPKPTEYFFRGFSEEIKAQVIAIVLEDIEGRGRIFRAILTELQKELGNRQMELGTKS